MSTIYEILKGAVTREREQMSRFDKKHHLEDCS